MNKRFIKTPLKGVVVQDTKNVGTRTVNLLMGEHAGEYVRGDIMDANAVIQAFDELKGNVDVNHDTLEELVDEIHTNNSDSKQRDEEEKAARISGDNVNSQAISAEKTRAEAAETEIKNAITTINDAIDGHLVTPQVFNGYLSEDATASDIIEYANYLVGRLWASGVLFETPK